MTDQHPLTDAKCREIANNLCFRWQSHVHQDEVLYSEDDMRAATDWQLGQVIEWLKIEKDYYVCEDNHTWGIFIEDFKKAMRPTTTPKNN